MKKRFKYIAISEAKRKGVFGQYLSMPISDKTRTLLISERLSFLRQEAELSQKDLCDIIGIAVTTYSGYEQGKHEPSAETICRLAELYGISANFILGVGCNDPYSEEIGNEYVQYHDHDLTMKKIKEAMFLVEQEEQELDSYLSGVADIELPSDWTETDNEE